MDAQTLKTLQELFHEVAAQKDWKAALDSLFLGLRGEFVFDNVAMYLLDSQTKGLEVVYARAMGRGKTAEADAAWGEGVANEVLMLKGVVLHGLTTPSGWEPPREAHLLGRQYTWACAERARLVRFGGPRLHFHLGSHPFNRLPRSWSGMNFEDTSA
jgi:hypothetical protein